MKSECMDGKAYAFSSETINGSELMDMIATSEGKYEMVYVVGCTISDFYAPRKAIQTKFDFWNTHFKLGKGVDIVDIVRAFPNSYFTGATFEK